MTARRPCLIQHLGTCNCSKRRCLRASDRVCDLNIIHQFTVIHHHHPLCLILCSPPGRKGFSFKKCPVCLGRTSAPSDDDDDDDDSSGVCMYMCACVEFKRAGLSYLRIISRHSSRNDNNNNNNNNKKQRVLQSQLLFRAIGRSASAKRECNQIRCRQSMMMPSL